MRRQILVILLPLIVISSCMYGKPISTEVSSTVSIPKETSQLSLTPTPDANSFSTVLETNQDYSQETLANVLFSKWLDLFLSDDMNLEKRIDSYVINKINIPGNQECAVKLEGLFITEANVLIETTLPLMSTTDYRHSDWVAGGGNIEGTNYITKLFTGVVLKSGNRYTLRVITQIPTCD